jgi:hypothetical protein
MAFFQTKNHYLGKILEGLAMEDVGLGILCPFWCILRLIGILCGHLVYFMVNWYILWLFGIF